MKYHVPDSLAHITHSHYRQQVHLYRELQNQHQGHPEVRHRHAHQGQKHNYVVYNRILFDCRQYSQGSSYDRRYGQCHQRQGDGIGNTGNDQSQHILSVAVGISEISVCQVFQIKNILLRQALIQVHLCSQRLNILIRSLNSQDCHSRIARKHSGQKVMVTTMSSVGIICRILFKISFTIKIPLF